MIRMILICLNLFSVSAVAAHFLVLLNLPGQVMSKAWERFETAGVPMHTWVSSPRAGPETQSVVRSSPDLAYAICLFDLMDSPIAINAKSWGAYGSLSLFDDKTNNVFVTDLEGDSSLIEVRVTRPGIRAVSPDEAETMEQIEVVEMPGRRGVALIRRLAPSDQLHADAQALLTEGQCAPIGNM